MYYRLLDKFFTRYPRKSHRLLEVTPPLMSLFLVTLPFWGALFVPVALAYFIIFFDIYWLYKSINLAICSFIAAKKIKQAEGQDWLAKAKNEKDFNKVYHLVVIPTYKERVEKLRQALESFKEQTFPLSRIMIFVAMEEREEEAKEKAKILKSEYGSMFGLLHFTFHPDLEGEVKGKSSNQAYAGKEAYEILVNKMKLDLNFITVSSVDADSIFDAQFLSYLSYSFLTVKDPYLKFWQSANVHYNNFWKVPAFIRVGAFFGSLWRASLLLQKMRLITNSTYTLSFKLLKDIGFWDVNVIPEDYRIFFKAFFATKGTVSVEPIFLKTSMDSAQSQTYFSSLMSKYHQERRWSWGISDDAVYLKWWFTVRDVPFMRKTFLIWNVLTEHILWPVNWFLITIAANVIVILNPVFTRTSLGYNLPRLSGFILTLCLFALFLMIYVDFNLRSKRYESASKIRQFIFLLEFVLLPISGFFLSALPALISHIQLLLGKRLEYKVTEKV